jgi:hypothetical protein
MSTSIFAGVMAVLAVGICVQPDKLTIVYNPRKLFDICLTTLEKTNNPEWEEAKNELRIDLSKKVKCYGCDYYYDEKHPLIKMCTRCSTRLSATAKAIGSKIHSHLKNKKLNTS